MSAPVAPCQWPAYARDAEVGRRRANDPPRGTGDQAPGTAATYLAALPSGPFGVQSTTEGSTMQFENKERP
jgi:hypothetical protein